MLRAQEVAAGVTNLVRGGRLPLGAASGVATTWAWPCGAAAAPAWTPPELPRLVTRSAFSTRLWACGRTLRLEFDCSPPRRGRSPTLYDNMLARARAETSHAHVGAALTAGHGPTRAVRLPTSPVGWAQSLPTYWCCTGRPAASSLFVSLAPYGDAACCSCSAGGRLPPPSTLAPLPSFAQTPPRVRAVTLSLTGTGELSLDPWPN